MNKATVKSLRAEINQALAEIGKKHELEIKTVGTATYTETSFRVKLECKEFGEGGIDLTAKKEWDSGCRIIGFEPEDFGKQFKFANAIYTITGLKLRRYKFPIQAVNTKNGRAMKFDGDFVFKLLRGYSKGE